MNLLRATFAVALLVIPPRVDAAELPLGAEGLTAPISVATPHDSTGRLFVQKQQAIIQVLRPSGSLDTPLLDLRALRLELDDGHAERSLLGFALHPDFTRNDRVYVSYSAQLRPEAPIGWNYTRKISEMTPAPSAKAIAPATDPTLITFDWLGRKHNGGAYATFSKVFKSIP